MPSASAARCFRFRPFSPTNAKVTAAVAVLRFAREGLEIDDIEARVTALEQERRLARERQRGAT